MVAFLLGLEVFSGMDVFSGEAVFTAGVGSGGTRDASGRLDEDLGRLDDERLEARGGSRASGR